jgi:Ca2+-binding EF-hand superfamily protein
MESILQESNRFRLNVVFLIAISLSCVFLTANGQSKQAQKEAALIKKYDKNGDGKLNAKERAAAKADTPAERYKREAKEKMLERFDQDKNGKLDEKERKTAFKTIKAERKEIDQAVMKKFDANDNGRIDKKEYEGLEEWRRAKYPNAVFLPAHDKQISLQDKKERVQAGKARRGDIIVIPERESASESEKWLAEVQGYQLPGWYDKANRVHGHTRLTAVRPTNHVDAKSDKVKLAWLDTDEFKHAGKYFNQLGVDVFSRHVRTGDEGAWWPSKVGEVLDLAKNRNIAKEIIDEAHQNDQRIIVYNRHMEDHGMAKAHPDWVCKDKNGKAYVRRGKMMCFNSPYRQHVQARLLELVDMGADGFYFDSGHQPHKCYCDFCKKNGKNRQQIIRETFLQFRRVVHERNPECVILISGRFEGQSHDLWRIADSPKIEDHLPPKYGGKDALGYSLGLTFIRDAADGKPAHCWRNNKTAVTDKEALWILSFGHVFNYDVHETFLANPTSERFRTGKQLVKYGAVFTQAMAAKKPVRNAIVHYPEGMPDGLKKKQLVHPVFANVYKQQVPTGIITDSQLREGIPDDCQLLVFPNTKKSVFEEAKVTEHLADFKARGGVVITNPLETAAKEMIAKVREQSIVFLDDQSEKIHLTAYTNPKGDELSVILFNTEDFDTVASKLYFPKGKSVESVQDIQNKTKLSVKKDKKGVYVDIKPFKHFQALSVAFKIKKGANKNKATNF